MELRYFLVLICFISFGRYSEAGRRGTKKSAKEKENMSDSLESLDENMSESSEEKYNESIDQSSTSHLPYPERHSHSPYVQMVFKLAAEAVEASDASQRISHQLSMNHGHGHSGAMIKVKVPLYKQSYPVLFQHGHVMHDSMQGLPYPYVPTMKGRASHGHRNSNRENYSGENSNLISHGLALAHGQMHGHQPSPY